MKKPIYLAFLVAFSCAPPSQNVDSIDFETEKQKILEVIGNETKYYFEENYEAWRNCFLDTSYVRYYGYWEGFKTKLRLYNGFDTLDQIKKAQFKRGSTLWAGSYEERINKNIRIYKDIAWITFDETSFDNKTQEVLGRSVGTRILEKHNGEWKIVYLSYYFIPDPIP